MRRMGEMREKIYLNLPVAPLLRRELVEEDNLLAL
jgi:hypothetical protein